MSGGYSENHCVYKGGKTYFNNGLIISVKRSLLYVPSILSINATSMISSLPLLSNSLQSFSALE